MEGHPWHPTIAASLQRFATHEAVTLIAGTADGGAIAYADGSFTVLAAGNSLLDSHAVGDGVLVARFEPDESSTDEAGQGSRSTFSIEAVRSAGRRALTNGLSVDAGQWTAVKNAAARFLVAEA